MTGKAAKICLGIFMGLGLMLLSPVMGYASLKLELVQPKVGIIEPGAALAWENETIKSWRANGCINVINEGRDGILEMEFKILDADAEGKRSYSGEFDGATPGLQICPFPDEPDRCADQEVTDAVDRQGIFKAHVTIRIKSYAKHLFKVKLSNTVFQFSIGSAATESSR
ncbi:MAG: hypothetical protein HY920_08165 [Elusimicrobia bacterium]|nr:hypothetical protein [Elusimicrobiota bacterium]